jgi:hypothetical protein
MKTGGHYGDGHQNPMKNYNHFCRKIFNPLLILTGDDSLFMYRQKKQSTESLPGLSVRDVEKNNYPQDL